MKATIAATAVAGTLVAGIALAQFPAPGGNAPTGVPTKPGPNAAALPTNSAPPRDPKVFPAEAVLPTPVPFDQMKKPTIAMPDGPIEPYLLTKDVGPFLVTARTFRGPDADKFAMALAKELREEFGLPAWILRSRDFPMRSNIRGIPPTAERGVPRSELSLPEKVRSYDEALVLVGNEKTLADSEKLWFKVKKLKPKCLNEIPGPFAWRKGLSTALRTTNPFVPAQDLFAGRRDEFVYKMNQGPNSIYNCSGRYSLEIARFQGRSTFQVQEAKTASINILKRSPLATAADDAEKMATALAKSEEIRSTGQPVYVYHDRQSSRVLVGTFNSPNDPAAVRLREYLLKNSFAMMDYKDLKTGKSRTRGLDKMIVPAAILTDLDNPDNPIRPQAPSAANKPMARGQ